MVMQAGTALATRELEPKAGFNFLDGRWVDDGKF